jgi:sulfoxide reductase heme-binding subunit YedZ
MQYMVKVFTLISLIPFIILSFKGFGFFSGLGANPIETIIHETGQWGIRTLIVTLLITPIGHYMRHELYKKLPKPLGLVSLFYILIHFLSYALIDQGGDIKVIIVDIIETPYLIVGWAGFLCLLSVGLISFKKLQSWFNKNRSTISGIIYTAAVLGVWHYYWQTKVIELEPVLLAILMILLTGWKFKTSKNKS